MTQAEEIDLATWAGQSMVFLKVWLEMVQTWDLRRIWHERAGRFDLAEICANRRDQYRAQVDRYVEALGDKTWNHFAIPALVGEKGGP